MPRKKYNNIRIETKWKWNVNDVIREREKILLQKLLSRNGVIMKLK